MAATDEKAGAERYPEHVKARDCQAEAQAVSEFLEWMFQRYTLATYHNHGDACSRAEAGADGCGLRGGALYPAYVDAPDLVAQCFGIDRRKLEAEKRDMLGKFATRDGTG